MVMRISGQRFRRDPVVYWLYWVALIACRASVTVGTKPLVLHLVASRLGGDMECCAPWVVVVMMLMIAW